MLTQLETGLHAQLLDRRERLTAIAADSPETINILRLLHEVDAALARIEQGSYGVCEVCRDRVEPELLSVDPLVRYCLPHLTPRQQRALEQDLNLAAQMQTALLPRRDFRFDGWQVRYHYEPLGAVGGDYCDLVLPGGQDGQALYFFLGDVSGKGIASALLVAQLHAVFRSLVALDLPVAEMVARANRILCESTIPAYYATLVAGRATRAGEVELCNAGHCPPLLAGPAGCDPLAPTGLPLGLFYGSEYASLKLRLAPGETLFLYTDGLSEARDAAEAEYGEARVRGLLGEHCALPPCELVDRCLADLHGFLSGAPKTDDLSVMVLGRARAG